MPVGKTNDHQQVIAEWRIDPANTNRVDPNSRRELLRIDKPQSNHNGGGTNDRALGMFLKGFGEDSTGELYVLGTTNLGPSGTAGKVLKLINTTTSSNATQNAFAQHGLVADLPNQADVTDTNLVNPWGLAFSALGPFWIADNHTGL
jgi:hypothetical protein